MDKIIPSFEKSLFDGTKEIIGDLTEIGIDSLLDDGLFKDIPVVGILVGIKNTAQNIHDRNLLRQTLQFIKEFNDGTIDSIKLQNYKEKIKDNPKKAEEELGRVLILLNNTIELEKSVMLANLFRNYVNEQISWNEFCEFSEIVRMLFINDVQYIKKIYSGSVADTSGMPLYPIDRLVSLGLINTSMKSIFVTTGTNGTRTDKYVNLSNIGGKFFQSINRC